MVGVVWFVCEGFCGGWDAEGKRSGVGVRVRDFLFLVSLATAPFILHITKTFHFHSYMIVILAS